MPSRWWWWWWPATILLLRGWADYRVAAAAAATAVDQPPCRCVHRVSSMCRPIGGAQSVCPHRQAPSVVSDARFPTVVSAAFPTIPSRLSQALTPQTCYSHPVLRTSTTFAAHYQSRSTPASCNHHHHHHCRANGRQPVGSERDEREPVFRTPATLNHKSTPTLSRYHFISTHYRHGILQFSPQGNE